MRTIANGLAPAACLLLLSASWLGGASAPPAYRHDAEEGVLRWRLSRSAVDIDVRIRAVQQRRSDETSHSGRFSEEISFKAGNGTKVFLSHHVGKARVLEELRVALWVKTDRPGVQLIGRVVLPDSLDPKTGKPVAVDLRGDSYSTPGLWQRLILHDPRHLLERQQRIQNRRLRSSVSLRGAYLSEVIVNAYTGPGTTRVFLDDLEVVPFLGKKPLTPLPLAFEGLLPRDEASVEVRQGQLLVNQRPARLRAVTYRGESLELLKAVGFNAVWFEGPADPKLLGRAHDAGLWVIAQPPAASTASSLDESPWNRVLLWHLGTDLGTEDLKRVEQRAVWLRQRDPRGRPITAGVTSGLLPHSRLLDLVSVRRESLASALDLRAYREWLEQRTRLTRAGTPLWTWIPTQPARSLEHRLADDAPIANRIRDLSVEPEQIRLFAYAALAAGVRGLGFWTEGSLEGDNAQARERLLGLSLLNLELRLIDDLLQNATRLGTISGRPRDVEATLFRTPYGAVLLASWYGKDSQFVPGQAAESSVSFIVPGLPESVAPWRVSLAGMDPLPRGRVAGGVPVQLDEFGLTGIVLFCNDRDQLNRIRRSIAASRKEAARIALQLARLKLERVERVDRALSALGHALPEAPALLERGRGLLAASWRDIQDGNLGAAYQNAERALRPLRLIQHAHWTAATKSLPTPLASPFATAFSTLPEHWRFVDQLKRGRFGPNLMPEADFEDVDAMEARGWGYVRQTIEGVDVDMELSPSGPHHGAYCLRLAVRAVDPERAPAVPETTPIQVTSASIPAEAGQVLRLSGWVRVESPISGSVAGATFTDSIGGEPLTLQWQRTSGWQKFVVFRPVSKSGEVSLRFALTGFGVVSFDDVSVQVLGPESAMQQAARKAPR